MLWLAGLIGIASVGAASLITFPEPEEEEDEVLNADEMIQTGHDLLDQIGSIEDVDIPDDDLFDLVAQDVHAESQLDDAVSSDAFNFSLESSPVAGEISGFESETAPLDAVEDVATTEELVLVGDWIASGPGSEVFDYEANSESLLLVWDDMATAAEEPQVDVSADPYDDEVMHVMMNNKSVAEVYGDPELTAADVTLIPLSSALIVGLEPA